MRTAIFGILFLGFAIGIHAGPAHAKNISNPLYALNKGSVSDSCLNKEEDVSKIGENAPVRRDIIVCTLVKAAPPELDYMLLRQNGGPHGIDPLLNALVPCPVSVRPASPSGHDAADPDSIPTLTSDDYVELCKIFYTNLKAANITPEIRFKDKPNLLFIRQSLLALFQSAEYGRRNGFVVLREDWTDATSGLESANYRPLVNPFFDDVALIRYLSGETAFEVVRNNFTSPGGNPLPTYADTRNEQKVIKIGTSDGNELSVWAPIMTGYASPLDYAWSLLGNLDNTIEIKIAEKDQKTVSSLLLSDRKPEKDDTANIQLAIVKAAGDFAKTKPDGAKIGTLLNNNGDGSVIGSDDQQVTADAALGLRFRLIREYNNHCSRLVPDTINLTATPFLSIDSQAQTVVTDIMENGEPKKQKRIVDAAALAGGIRLDYEASSKRKGCSGTLRTGQDYLSAAGRDIPGLKIGFVYEGLTDNHNLWSAQRSGLEVSPPSFPFMAGYRAAFPLDALSRDPIEPGELARATERSWFDALSNGWYAEWDFAAALDYIDYSRLPRKFDENYPYVVNTETPEFGLYGGNFSVELTKRNLFGASSDTAWITIGADYFYREGFGNDTRASNHVELSLKFSDPGNEGRFIGLTYKDGFNYRSQEDDDQLAFEVGAQF